MVFPHPPQNRRSEAKLTLKDLVGKYQVGVVAIGNGTACRETEELIAEIIAEGTRFSQGGDSTPTETEATPADASHSPGAEVADEIPTGHEGASEHDGHPAEAVTAAEPESHTLGDSGSDEGHPAQSESEQPNSIPQPESSTEDALGNGSGGDHASAESHSSSPHEETVEALPPVSGGAPDDIFPTLPPISGGAPDPDEVESAPTPDSEETPSPEISSTAVLEGDPQGDRSEESSTSATEEHAPTGDHLPVPLSDHSGSSGEEPAATPIASTPPDPEPTASPSEAPSPAATGDHLPTPGEESAAAPLETEVSATPAAETTVESGASEPEPAAAAAAPLEGTPPAMPASVPAQAAPGGRPPRQGRGGKGNQDSSRKREPRAKQPPSPPPPQTPPQPHPADAWIAQLAYVIVNEAGASVYSTSQAGREELPEFDPTLRSGISIGRRLQDPLSELVKIEPQNIGVGLYQHDVNPKQLKETLESVISSCVNFVGVDLNTASVPLLRHVSGLNQLTARRIVDYRKDRGPFARRAQLMEVEGVGPATFTQAAGFLKLTDGEDPLDRTWVHPESYPAATKLLEKFGFTPDVVKDKVRLPELRTQLAQADVPALVAELEIGEFTLRDILEALGRPERDPRDDLPKPIFKKGVLKLEDLTPGMELKGTVLNVVDFGAFVDIGLKDSGLVHISQLANRYVKSPHDVVSVSDVVTVWVMLVDQERKRVSLTMVKPGTERHRARRVVAEDVAAARRVARLPIPIVLEKVGEAPPARDVAADLSGADAPATRLGLDIPARRCTLGRRTGRNAIASSRSGSWSRSRAIGSRSPPRRCSRWRFRTIATRTGRPRPAFGTAGAVYRTGPGGWRASASPAGSRPRPRRSSSPTASQPTITAQRPSPAAVQGRAGRKCPAPDLRSAQATLAGPRRRARRLSGRPREALR